MSYSTEVLADSPVLYLRFEESSGATCTDSSASAPMLTVPNYLMAESRENWVARIPEGRSASS